MNVELISLARKTQHEIETRGEFNKGNVFLRDFAKELLKRRVLARVEFVRLIELNRSEKRTAT